ncbi:MAG TPA: type VI secretion system tube protein Hcp [Pyrinomonadaceae bacterium]|nr:type VI secretion system tube protein Hcp [Pyrinomonadaceae bacterium]HMP66127.1 type VI secretion system tube protein Hcp [Pyrinomonadaceae bacterium]
MAYEYFLKMDGLFGDSDDPRHFGEIKLISVTWGSDRGQTGGGAAGSGSPQINELKVFKNHDRTSPILMQASSEGRHFKEARLTIEKRSLMGAMLISHVVDMRSIIVDSVLPRPGLDEITLSFGHIRFEKGAMQLLHGAQRI